MWLSFNARLNFISKGIVDALSAWWRSSKFSTPRQQKVVLPEPGSPKMTATRQGGVVAPGFVESVVDEEEVDVLDVAELAFAEVGVLDVEEFFEVEVDVFDIEKLVWTEDGADVLDVAELAFAEVDVLDVDEFAEVDVLNVAGFAERVWVEDTSVLSLGKSNINAKSVLMPAAEK